MKDINKKFKQEMIVDTKKQDDEDLAVVIDLLKKSTTLYKDFSKHMLFTWYGTLNSERIFNEFVKILPENTYTLVSNNDSEKSAKTLTFIHDHNYMNKLTLKYFTHNEVGREINHYVLYSEIIILPRGLRETINLKDAISLLASNYLFNLNNNISPFRTRYLR